MPTFTRDTAEAPAPSTWDYCTHAKPATGKPHLDHTIALCTCPNGHTCGLSRDVHTIIDGEGRLSPSYVCPVQGCTFHDWVSLAGWNWAWYNMNCAPDRP
jgi:hypothetical protein